MASIRREFSEAELRLIDILRKNGGSPMSSKRIAAAHYRSRKSPANAVRSVVVTLNNVIKKSKGQRECFAIKKSRRRGPSPIEFWLEDTSPRGDRERSSSRR